ncbi:MAG TPA: HAD family phosphatase [Saprospiraceae bacterium]|nr:HAD family phosphatase [Saprospiraceae bacterium]
MIKSVLTDLDGVLCDSCDWHYEALNKALQQIHGFSISRDDHLNTYNGLPTKTKLSIIEEKEQLTLSLNDILELKNKYTVDIINWKCRKDTIKIDFCEQIKNRNYLLGCVTNCSEVSALLILERLGIRDYFDLVVSNRDFKNPKPNPEPYRVAIDRISDQYSARLFKDDQFLIIEDSPQGIGAVKQLSCKHWIVQNMNDVCWENLEMELNKYQ